MIYIYCKAADSLIPLFYLVGTKVVFNSTSCAMAHECENWSISTGCWRKEYSALCCDTDNCNNRVAPGIVLYFYTDLVIISI